jgi:hypothetical protein
MIFRFLSGYLSFSMLVPVLLKELSPTLPSSEALAVTQPLKFISLAHSRSNDGQVKLVRYDEALPENMPVYIS